MEPAVSVNVVNPATAEIRRNDRSCYTNMQERLSSLHFPDRLMNFADFAQVRFPYETPPPPGTVLEMAPGIFWVRLPLPVALDHVNVWVLDDGDGWTIVDCGLETEQSMAIWSALITGPLAGKPVRRLVATHSHPDHIGAARRLVREFDIPLATTQVEWENAVMRRAEVADGVSVAQAQFFIDHGYPVERATQRTSFGKIMIPLMPDPPPLDEVFADGDIVRFGQRNWRVIVAGGHAEAHASFYCADDHILIAGDQILPRITPFVGVEFRAPDSDPLKTYLASLDLFGGLAVNTLVLPGHGIPFSGLPARLDQLHQHHDARLGRVIESLDQPRHAFDIAAQLFPKAVGTGHERMALAESIAHLHYLMYHDRVVRSRDHQGVWRFERGYATPLPTSS